MVSAKDFEVGDCVVVNAPEGNYTITTPGSWGYIMRKRPKYIAVRFHGLGRRSRWHTKRGPHKSLGTEDAEFDIQDHHLRLYTPQEASDTMETPTPRYKVDDVVLSINDHIQDYGPEMSNQLCIVREVCVYPGHFDESIVYHCTTIATGDEVAFYEYEIVEQGDETER